MDKDTSGKTVDFSLKVKVLKATTQPSTSKTTFSQKKSSSTNPTLNFFSFPQMPRKFAAQQKFKLFPFKWPESV